MNTKMNMNNIILESADLLANQLLEEMVKIKTDIEHFELILDLLMKYQRDGVIHGQIFRIRMKSILSFS